MLLSLNVILHDKKQDQAGALLLACTISILKKIIINEIKIVLSKIKIGFLDFTGSLKTLTFSFLINFNSGPPLVIIYEPQPTSDR